MSRRAVFFVLFALALTGCGTTATTEGGKSSGRESASTAATTTASGQPKTLEAATASEQENADRYSSGDFAGQWLLYSKRLRDAINEDDYAAFAKRCIAETGGVEGVRFTVEGVRMDGETTAIVRVGLMGALKSRTMLYEDGQWLQEPTDELAANFGKPVDGWTC